LISQCLEVILLRSNRWKECAVDIEQRPERLPVLRTVWGAYALTFRHFPALVSLTWVWLLVLTAANIAFCWIIWPAHQAAVASNAFTMPIAEVLVPLLLSTAIGSSIAVGWHRLILLGANPRTIAYVRSDTVVLRYLLISLLLLLPMAALCSGPAFASLATDATAIIAGIIAGVGIFIGYAVIAARLGLVLPAIALQREDIGLGAAWRATSGSFWRLFCSSMLLFISMTLPFVIWGIASGMDDPAQTETFAGYVATSLFGAISGLLFGIIGVTMLSLQFRHFFPEHIPTSAS
jgi:hypothetical protein